MSNLNSQESIKIKEYFETLNHDISDEIIQDYGRVYKIDDKKYPSVTTFLSKVLDKTWLDEWVKRIGKEEADKKTKIATDRGTSMHELTESYLKGDLKSDNEIVNELGYKLFAKLRTMFLYDIEPIIQEVPLWSDKLKLAGRVDAIGYYKGNLSIIDFKSSNKPKDIQQIFGYFLQTTLYALMLKEMTNITVKQVVILIAVDDGFPQVFVRPTKNYIQECINLVKVFHIKNNIALL